MTTIEKILTKKETPEYLESLRISRENEIRDMEKRDEDYRIGRRLIHESKINKIYAAEMEKCGGSNRSPLTYAAHIFNSIEKFNRGYRLINGI